jgi:hypothetical protein
MGGTGTQISVIWQVTGGTVPVPQISIIWQVMGGTSRANEHYLNKDERYRYRKLAYLTGDGRYLYRKWALRINRYRKLADLTGDERHAANRDDLSAALTQLYQHWLDIAAQLLDTVVFRLCLQNLGVSLEAR